MIRFSIIYLYNLWKNQWLDKPKLNYLQNLKLKKMIKYAYQNVGYYYKLFCKAGISPKDIRTVADLSKIPITNRTDIQNLNVCERMSKKQDIKKCIIYTTSGTTEKPLEIYLTKKETDLQGWFHLRMLFANGYSWKDRLVILTHPQFIPKNNKKSIFQQLGFFNIEYLSIFQKPRKLLMELLRFKPTIIKGYTHIIKTIAYEIKANNIKEIYPRLIFCTAEFLSYDDRNFISEIFKSDVIDYYSSAECGLIAWECKEHKGYHINSDNVIVEIIKNGKYCLPGEEGEVVITNLNSYTMPFIRYRIGDRAIFTNSFCSCGRSFYLLTKVFR